MAVITAAAIGVAGTIYAASQAKKQQNAAIKASEKAQAAADPYAQYRGGAAQQLNALQQDPSSITDMASYKARLQAAQRAAAANGFTGSGNALIMAADAGGEAYQQEFNNLAMLSGAAQGLGNATSAYAAGNGARSAANDNYLSSISGTVNNATNLAQTIGNFNKPLSSVYATPPTTASGASWLNAYGAAA